ncbi:transcription initiation factor TFIID subunit 4-like [Dendronephthya gigantea]|uniref:transcription initiation factor TFIID subunit 4-like n=1 Tax=Dendronephthya gigantea TaxID=151771 RepID=UPI001068F588|nr:transcription initiation factor TFIID subunit 4-like [Dendronephthya gigantea]
MASSFIEDILGSEVDEKAVSAFVGSLESQLASPSGGTSSGASTTNNLPRSQRPNHVPSSTAPSNSSQSNNSSVATVININTATGSPITITGKSSYISSSSSSTPINIAPRPVVTSTVSLAPKTVTLLSPQTGNRGYLPVQSASLGLPLMMGQVRGQLPHAPRLVSTAMSLPRGNTAQNTVHKLSPQLHNMQQTGSTHRIAIKQEPKSQLNQPPTLLTNNVHLHSPATGKPVQNHAMVIKNETKIITNHVPVPHSGVVKSEPAKSVVTQHNSTAANQNRAAAQAQVNRVKEQVMKLKSFFTRLCTLATDQSPEIGKAVQELINAVMENKLTEEDFTAKLEKTLHSPSQPNLVHFLKSTLPFLRMAKQQQSAQTAVAAVANSPTVRQVQKPVQSVAAVSKSQPTILPSTQINRQIPVPAVVNKPRIKPATSAPQQIVLNQHTFAQLTPQQQQRILLQHPSLQQLFPKTQLATSKPGIVLISSQANPPAHAAHAVITAKPQAPPTSAAQAQDKSKARPTSSISAVTSGNDDDINDVACMAGVNLQEEQSKILATNSEILNLQLRSCKDSFFLNNKILQKQIEDIAKKHGVSSLGSNICGLVSHATQERLTNIMEKLSIFSLHRLETMKDDPTYQTSSDVKSQLRVFEQIDEIERRKREAREREVLIRAAKSRSRQEDPEQARLKEKAKQLQLEEEETLRKRAANKTALDAIGPRKKRKLDEALNNAEGSPGANSGTGSTTTSTIRSQFPRQRTRRVILKDLLLIMEQEKEMCNSKLLYKALMK